jgi:4'-phosphopantetheinyl transferase
MQFLDGRQQDSAFDSRQCGTTDDSVPERVKSNTPLVSNKAQHVAPGLGAEDVHVWWANLDVAPDLLERLRANLSDDELRRSERFVFERDRKRFIAGRGVLRTIIGRYLNRDPVFLQFVYNEYGKPGLVPESHGAKLTFNMSHSDDVGVFAIAVDRELGVDVERISEDRRILEVAAQYFSNGEIVSLRALSDALQLQGFFNCWTRKEAYVKARGLGLSISLESFVVSLVPGQRPALLRSNEPLAALNWSFCSLSAAPGFVAVLVAAGSRWRLQERTWGFSL